MTITIRRIETAESDNAYTQHDTYDIIRDGDVIGALLLSHINYQKFESEITSGRWVMRQRTYLWPLRRHLLDQNQLRARLAPQLTPFRGDTGVLTIIDDIIIDDEDLSRQELHDLMHAARSWLAEKSDFLSCLAWQRQANHLGVTPLDFLVALGPYRGTAISQAFAVARIPYHPVIVNHPSSARNS